ncbi:MAG: acetylglutamate kinase [Oscillospiraceae bacterium]|nr:acetylglutamate kinase [Oscillospiraceae bacterium]
MTDVLERAMLLSEALPNIQQYSGKTVVIKYGGAAMTSGSLRESVINDIILLSCVGLRVVLVHGGGPEINALLEAVGKQPEFVGGLRYTDRETMDLVQMALCGRTGKSLAALVTRRGGKAISLSGLDGGLFRAVKMKGEVDCGYVGKVTEIDPAPVNLALDGGYVPIVSSVAHGIDEDTAYNINADTAAAELAAAMAAEKLILLTDVPGILRDKNDPESLISEIKLSDIPALLKSGAVGKGMIPKIDCCVTALRKGVGRASILDGRAEHSVLVEILTHEGIGTMIVNG